MDWIIPFAVCAVLVWAQHREPITAWWRRLLQRAGEERR